MIVTADDMYQACKYHFTECKIAVFAAAVADYRPEEISCRKIKKAGDELYIKLIKNRDIAYEFGKVKRPDQLSIGFALETDNEILHAQEKQ